MARNSLTQLVRSFFRKKSTSYARLQQMLGFAPLNEDLYITAFSHRSGQSNLHGRIVNNERLEFLGDSVLSTIIADWLYTKFPDKREGELTTLRSRIVQRSSLDSIAAKLGLQEYIIANHQSIQNCQKMHINGNAFEALLGAIYLDRGYSYCYRFIQKLHREKNMDIDALCQQEGNFKSKFIEWAQRNHLDYEFVLLHSQFDSHTNLATFHSQVTVAGMVAGKGKGTNKRESQQQACREALKYVKTDAFKRQLQQPSNSSTATSELTDTERTWATHTTNQL